MELEPDYESLPDSSMTTNMIAGALAGITEHLVMYPFDNIKTRMQLIKSGSSIYGSMSSTIQRVSSTEGLKALWKGVSSMAVGAGPSHAIYFATYEHCKGVFGVSYDTHNHIGTGLAGACATVASDGFMNPFDVIKQRMQLPKAAYRSLAECGLDILKREGIGAFYVSYPTTLIMNVPFQSIHFVAYEYSCKTMNPSGEYNPLTHVVSGGLAGAVASCLTTPLDVVKTLLQTRGTSSDANIRNVGGFIQGCRLVYQLEGIKGFSRGMAPRVLANMPATAICWTMYEFMKHIINKS